ncbi:hypothetical protein C2845_PM15G16140 [Panicum miliaceum]|uniref:Uncharacterized protein n=1 Tax=Panicum miliaceum TaxID=4540 RepID=A0A3L6QAA0_PANMI|nr:hypothetical protein C2845_PM15G16140 [Panicum miliaceum]
MGGRGGRRRPASGNQGKRVRAPAPTKTMDPSGSSAYNCTRRASCGNGIVATPTHLCLRRHSTPTSWVQEPAEDSKIQ